MPYVGILQAAGLAKESVVGTLVTPPTEFLPLIAPDSFTEAIQLLESKGIRAQPDAVVKVVQGPASLKGGKIKVELEPENCGNIFMGTFGTDTLAETASFVVTTGVNDKIDFKESGGAQLHATLPGGTYTAGTTSATEANLCDIIEDALVAAGTLAYTVTYSASTKKFTIGPTTGTIQILWNTGANSATAAKTLLGFSNTDTANAATVTSDSTTQTPSFGHTFTRASVAQLPTYTWWFHKGAKYFQFAGCMMSKLEIDIKSKDMVVLDADYTALTYDDTGITQTPTYSTYKPFKFNQVAVNIDGAPVLNYEAIKIIIDNMVEADMALSASIYPAKIYSKGMKVTLDLTMFLEDTTAWGKFLAGTSTHVNVVLTSSELVPGTLVAFTLTLDFPVVNYTAAPLLLENGVLKINFAGTAVYDSVTAKTMSAALVNSRVTAY